MFGVGRMDRRLSRLNGGKMAFATQPMHFLEGEIQGDTVFRLGVVKLSCIYERKVVSCGL